MEEMLRIFIVGTSRWTTRQFAPWWGRLRLGSPNSNTGSIVAFSYLLDNDLNSMIVK